MRNKGMIAAAAVLAAVTLQVPGSGALQQAYAMETENVTETGAERTVTVEGSAERDDLTGDTPEESIYVTVEDPETGEEYRAEAFYTGSELTREEWTADLTAELEFTDYDADYFAFGDTLYEKNENEPLPEEAYAAILTALELPSDRYRITGISWSGEAYTSDGAVCRKAVISGETLHRVYTDRYAGTYELPAVENISETGTEAAGESRAETETVRKEAAASSADASESTKEAKISDEKEKENFLKKLGSFAADVFGFLTGKGAGVGITGLTFLIAAAAFLIVRAAGKRGKKN